MCLPVQLSTGVPVQLKPTSAPQAHTTCLLVNGSTVKMELLQDPFSKFEAHNDGRWQLLDITETFNHTNHAENTKEGREI